jgi:hypothetical protein
LLPQNGESVITRLSLTKDLLRDRNVVHHWATGRFIRGHLAGSTPALSTHQITPKVTHRVPKIKAMNTQENSARDSVESTDLFGFDEWWNTEGSGMPPLAAEDREEHMRRVAKAAWDRAANPWRIANEGKWWCQYCLSVVDPVNVTYDETHDPRSGGCGGCVQIIEPNAGGQP